MARPRAYKLEGSFGEFKGSKVYYFGFKERPKFLPKTGRGFGGLKHLLELLKERFKKFTLTFTPGEDSVRLQGKLFKVRLSAAAVKRLGQRRWDANRQLNLRLGRSLLTEAFPDHFHSSEPQHVYQRGMFSGILSASFDSRLLSPDDREALTRFVAGESGEVGSLDIPAAYEASRDVQLLYLKKLVAEFDAAIATGHDESWWQQYFEKNVLFFQDNYISRLNKMNVGIVGTAFPDFAVVTSDGYLDILEIKKPGTTLLNEDTSRHNYYWTAELAKAISQVENYIDNVTRHGDAIRSTLRDINKIDLRIIKPRGLIIAGRASTFGGNAKVADDFRRLAEGLKNIQIVPYDEVSQRLKNTISSIERLAAFKQTTKQGARRE